MSLKRFLKGKKTYVGIVVAAAGQLVPFAPDILAAAGVSPRTSSTIITIGGLLYAAYGRKVAHRSLN